MAIVDTINSMYENVGEVYDTITNVDLPTNKNIENIPSTIRKSYLDIMNNGIDTIYDNWEKVNGTGTSITLNNTEEAPMTIEYKGNTSQGDLPTGFQQLEYIESTGTQYIDTGFKANYNTRVVIDFIANQRSYAWLLGSRISYDESNYSVLLWNGGGLRTDYNIGGQDMGASINTRYILDKNKNVSTLYQNGTQVSQITATYSEFNPNHNMYLFACNNNGSVSAMATVKMFSCKIYDNGKLIRDYIPCYRNSDNAIGLYDIVNNQFYANQGTGTFTKGSNLPTPEAPQDIHIVSGDNYINVCGKNLFDKSIANLNKGINTNTGNLYNDTNCFTSDFIEVEASGVYYTASGYSTVANRVYGAQYDSNKQYVGGIATNVGDKVFYISNANTKYIRITGISSEIDTYQLEKGSTATTYEAYKGASYEINLGNIELCKIGTYQDSIKKSTGKNLFDGETELGSYDSNGNKAVNNNCRRTIDFIDVLPNTTYTLSRSGSIFNCKYLYYDKNKNYISSQVLNSSFTTPDNCYYLNFFSDQLPSNYANLMINEGTTALPYEPYGTSWYLNKQISKVVLNGSEAWAKSYNTNVNRYYIPGTFINTILNVNTIDLISDYFTCITPTQSDAYNIGLAKLNNTSIMINYALTDTAFDTVEKFKTWLSTHNTIVYYALATPTYTQITDSTLLSQLEALYNAKSKNSQTNITQENNDLPFILDTTALKQLTQ